VKVISKRGLLDLGKKHPATVEALRKWYKAAKKADIRSFHAVRETFSTADQVGNVLIFNILGGSYRLIARVNYPAGKLYIKALLTHREYDRKEWMKWA
jgi:mRNA interferase HigB